MQTKHFGYIREIAEQRSITKAAENLWMSQQALSRILDSVEKELGFKIFERTSKGVVVTQKGEKVLWDFERITNIMHGWETSREEGHKQKILLQYILSDLILDDLFCETICSTANLELEWETMGPPELVKRIKAGEQSWGILIASPQTDIFPKLQKTISSQMIRAEIIGSASATKMQILLHKDDMLAQKQEIMLSDLQEKTFVINKGIIVTETPQKLLQATKKKANMLPYSVKTVEYVAHHENTFTCLPGFIARNNSYVKNGDVIVKSLQENLDEGLCCYLLYNAAQKIEMSHVVNQIRNYMDTVAATLY